MRRLWYLFLLMMVTLGLMAPRVTWASSFGEAQTRIGGLDVVVALCTGGIGFQSPGFHWGSEPPRYDVASDSTLAAEGVRPSFGNLFPGDVPSGTVAGPLSELQAAQTTGSFDFVVQNGKTVLGQGHPFLAGGGRVEYAGTIDMLEGQVVRWTNGSGHFKPAAQFAGNAGLPMDAFSPVQVPVFGGPVLQLPVFQ